MRKNYTATIDLEVCCSDLLGQWKNGNRKHVIDTLATDHPGLCALFLVQGILDGKLSKAECNTIANRLIDKRQAVCLDDNIPFIE